MITFLGILIAGITGMAIGFVWYHPRVFGTLWMRLSGISPEQVSGGRRAQWATLLGFVASLIMASILYFQVFTEEGSLKMFAHASWLWVGFVVPVLLNSVLWERKSLKLYAINIGYWLVVMLAMTLEYFFILS